MGFLGNLVNALGAGYTAFRESMLNADPQQGGAAYDFDAWGQWKSRRSRYDLHWGMYQNNVFQDLLRPGLGTRYKVQFGLYKFTRHLYNPAYRLGEFWAASLYGGGLDRQAGDGESEQSALPILTENEAIRPALARLWADSSWQVEKELYGRFGAVLGDVAIKLEDDPIDQTVRMRVVHPGSVKWIERDRAGAVTAYILEEVRYDPRAPDLRTVGDPRSTQRIVTYTERATLEGDEVAYVTLLDGAPYPWNGAAAQWRAPYGFVPLYLAQHERCGLDWGLNCFHAGLSRFREVDDQASGLSDQIRKAIRAPKLITGIKNIKELIPVGGPGTVNSPEPGRAEYSYLAVPGSKDNPVTVHDLTFPLDIPGVMEHLRGLLGDIEKNYPELLADADGISGAPTAEAIRRARQKAAQKVQARRAGYDDVLTRAQCGALAIGSLRGYRDYEGLGGPEALFAGTLAHTIGHRAVFEVDPLDAINEDKAFWEAAGQAVNAGVPLEVYLERNGWSEEDLARLSEGKEAAHAVALTRQQQMQAAGFDAAANQDEGNSSGDGGGDGNTDQ